jgi:hypothetical protein
MIISEQAVFVASSVAIFSSAVQILIVKGSAQYDNVHFVHETRRLSGFLLCE